MTADRERLIEECASRAGRGDDETAKLFGRVMLELRRTSNVVAEAAKLRSDRDELAAAVREWVCGSCMHVYPGPPQKGFACVMCPKCGGPTMPKTMHEKHELQLSLRGYQQREQSMYNELTTALARLEAAEKLVAKWRTEHALGGAHSLIERVIFRDCANDLEAALSSPTQEPDADRREPHG